MTAAELLAVRARWSHDPGGSSEVLLGLAVKDCRLLLDEHAAMLTNLTSVQARCTELLEEVRRLRAGIVLPGFTCSACGLFTGFEREVHTRCRACDAPRPA